MSRCNEIIMNSNSKGNLCCSSSVDMFIGCPNKCVSCYGLKVSMLPKEQFHTDNPIRKVYDDKKYRSSVKKFVNKGITYSRLGKLCDCGYDPDIGTLSRVIETANEEGVRFVFVTKSLDFDGEIARLLKKNEVVLHMSLGMISQAESDKCRIARGRLYERYGVNVKYRIVEDITKPRNIYSYVIENNAIITPLRLNSKEDCKRYDIDMNKYEFKYGYYRPIEMHKSWEDFEYFCGEIGSEIKCCECLVNI
jgi:hypothetical protein